MPERLEAEAARKPSPANVTDPVEALPETDPLAPSEPASSEPRAVDTTRADAPQARAEVPRPVMHQVAEAARLLRDGPVELTLKPEELGTVRLTLQPGDGAMTVVVAAERPETLDLLRRHIDQLAHEFRDLGFENLNFSFSHDEQQRGAPGTLAENGSPDPVPAASPDLGRPTPATTGSVTAGLDLRL